MLNKFILNKKTIINIFKKIVFTSITIFLFFNFLNFNSYKNLNTDKNLKYNNLYPINNIEVVEVDSNSFTFVLKDFSKRQGNQTYDDRYEYEFYQDLNLVNQFDLIDVKENDSKDEVDIYLKYPNLKSGTSYTVENVYFYFTIKGEEFEYNSDDYRILSLSDNPLIVKTKLSRQSKIILYVLVVILIIIILFSFYILISKLRKRNEDRDSALGGGFY